jgi:penicillin-binding protein 2
MRRDKQEAQAQFNRRALVARAARARSRFGVLGSRLYSLQILEQERATVSRQQTINSITGFNRPRAAGLLDRFGEAHRGQSRQLSPAHCAGARPAIPAPRWSACPAICPCLPERIDRLVAPDQRARHALNR